MKYCFKYIYIFFKEIGFHDVHILRLLVKGSVITKQMFRLPARQDSLIIILFDFATGVVHRPTPWLRHKSFDHKFIFDNFITSFFCFLKRKCLYVRLLRFTLLRRPQKTQLFLRKTNGPPACMRINLKCFKLEFG